MTEEDARLWLANEVGVPRETMAKLDLLVGLVLGASHNLIAPSTADHIWTRHIADSAQLVPLAAGAGSATWYDLGSGAGFPGLVVAMITMASTTLIEPRRLRVEFLRSTVAALGLASIVQILPARVETVDIPPAAIISARAFATLDTIFTAAARVASRDTLWLLPKGRSAQAELEVARRSWQGEFALVPSVTDPTSAIVVARHVRPRQRATKGRG